eukprot:UN02825
MFLKRHQKVFRTHFGTVKLQFNLKKSQNLYRQVSVFVKVAPGLQTEQQKS